MAQAPVRSRRRFTAAIISGLGASIAAALSVPAFAYLFTPKRTPRRNDFIELGDIAALTPDQPQEWTYQRIRRDGWRTIRERATAWVVKRPDNQVVALHPSCTHLGCAYHWEASKSNFSCPCHASSFGVDGEVLSGPAPRALDRFETRVQDGKVLIGRVIVTSSSDEKPVENQKPV